MLVAGGKVYMYRDKRKVRIKDTPGLLAEATP